MTSKITFEKATVDHKERIFSWLDEPHVQEFWDNTQSHRDDILNFMGGRKDPSTYCNGNYIYWVAITSSKPYAMLMTIQETIKDDIGKLKLSHLSTTGHTYGLDYMIGNKEYLGKGYGTNTLIRFIDFFRSTTDRKVDTFFVDPASDNTKAKRVYEKAGFKHVGDFVMEGNYSGSGKNHHLLIKKFYPTVTLEPAGIDDYPMIQNMAQLYADDLSKKCNHGAHSRQVPNKDLFKNFDFKNYFTDDSRKAYLVKIYDDVAGFILLNQATTTKKTDWNVGEFFILSRYQRHGIGRLAAEKVWHLHPGQWEVSVIPENISALKFWEHTITKFTDNRFSKDAKLIDFDKQQPNRIIYTFTSNMPNRKGNS